jgi:hypothetical protein
LLYLLQDRHKYILTTKKYTRSKNFWEKLIAYFPFSTNWAFRKIIREACIVGTANWGIYVVRRWDDLRWHDIQAKFHDDGIRHSINIKVITFKIWRTAVLVLLMGGICEVCLEIASCSMLYITSFTKSGKGVQAILKLNLGYLRSWNVGINVGRDLWSNPLRWAQMSWCIYTEFHTDWFRLSKVFKGGTHTDGHTHSRIARRSHKPNLSFFKTSKVY